MKVEFKDSFAKDLRGLKDKGLLKCVKDVIESVEKADSLSFSLSGFWTEKTFTNTFRDMERWPASPSTIPFVRKDAARSMRKP